MTIQFNQSNHSDSSEEFGRRHHERSFEDDFSSKRGSGESSLGALDLSLEAVSDLDSSPEKESKKGLRDIFALKKEKELGVREQLSRFKDKTKSLMDQLKKTVQLRQQTGIGRRSDQSYRNLGVLNHQRLFATDTLQATSKPTFNLAVEIAGELQLSTMNLTEFESVVTDLFNLYHETVVLDEKVRLKSFIESYVSQKIYELSEDKAMKEYQVSFLQLSREHDLDLKLYDLKTMEGMTSFLKDSLQIHQDLDESLIELSDAKVLLQDKENHLLTDIEQSKETEEKLKGALSETTAIVSKLRDQSDATEKGLL